MNLYHSFLTGQPYNKGRTLLLLQLWDIDLLDEVKGIGNYNDLLKESLEIELDGHRVHILSIPGLIIAKEAANREKDMPGLKVLYALQEAESNDE